MKNLEHCVCLVIGGLTICGEPSHFQLKSLELIENFLVWWRVFQPLNSKKNAFNHSKNFPPIWEFFFILTIGITEFMCLVMQFNLAPCLTQLLFGLSTQILSTYISNLDISENWQNCLYIHVCFVDCYTCRSFSNKQVKTFFLRDPLWIKFGCATWPLEEKRKERDALWKKITQEK